MSIIKPVVDLDIGSGLRVLKATTGAYQLTGGVAGTKTTLMQVPLPDGWMADMRCRLILQYTVNYTNSANTKQFGVDIGATAGTAITIRSQSVTTTGQATELVVMQRNAAVPNRFWVVVPNNARVFGSPAAAGSTVGVAANASINPDATGQSLFFWATINPNTEQVTYEHIYAAIEKAEQ